MLLLTVKGEREVVVKFVDVDVVFAVPNGWFSQSAVEADGSGRMGRRLSYFDQCDSIGLDSREDKAKYPGV